MRGKYFWKIYTLNINSNNINKFESLLNVDEILSTKGNVQELEIQKGNVRKE